jgi:hypothetical protein
MTVPKTTKLNFPKLPKLKNLVAIEFRQEKSDLFFFHVTGRKEKEDGDRGEEEPRLYPIFMF